MERSRKRDQRSREGLSPAPEGKGGVRGLGMKRSAVGRGRRLVRGVAYRLP